jgi:hypothetical protein
MWSRENEVYQRVVRQAVTTGLPGETCTCTCTCTTTTTSTSSTTSSKVLMSVISDIFSIYKNKMIYLSSTKQSA